jgi:hypothetical protein
VLLSSSKFGKEVSREGREESEVKAWFSFRVRRGLRAKQFSGIFLLRPCVSALK